MIVRIWKWSIWGLFFVFSYEVSLEFSKQHFMTPRTYTINTYYQGIYDIWVSSDNTGFSAKLYLSTTNGKPICICKEIKAVVPYGRNTFTSTVINNALKNKKDEILTLRRVRILQSRVNCALKKKSCCIYDERNDQVWSKWNIRVALKLDRVVIYRYENILHASLTLFHCNLCEIYFCQSEKRIL